MKHTTIGLLAAAVCLAASGGAAWAMFTDAHPLTVALVVVSALLAYAVFCCALGAWRRDAVMDGATLALGPGRAIVEVDGDE